MCGFSDIRTLNTAFVKSYGVLPKEFRKNSVLFPNLNYMTFNQDKIDNQVFYSDRGSFDILQYYLEKNFEKTFNAKNLENQHLTQNHQNFLQKNFKKHLVIIEKRRTFALANQK